MHYVPAKYNTKFSCILWPEGDLKKLIPTFPGQIMVNTWRDRHTAQMVIAPHADCSAACFQVACSDNGFTVNIYKSQDLIV